jgi:ABC-2 type transport system permease protein
MKVTLRRVVRSEWTKLRALRATWIVLGVTGLLVIGLAVAVGWSQHRATGRGEPPPTTGAAVGGALLGVDLLALVIGVFGVLAMTGEYASGLIRATLAAVPRRLPVLWAKAIALVGVSAPVMLAACLAALLASRLFLGPAGPSLGQPAVVRAAAGAAAATVAMGLIGLGIGAMLRHTAASITVLVVGMLIIPALLPAILPHSARDTVLPYVPTAAAQAMYSVGSGDNPFTALAPAAGAAVLAGWVALVLAGGAVVLRRRDA